MRVNIGKYKNWIGPYQIANLLQNIGVSEDRCHSIGEWLSNTWVNEFCTWIDSKRKRKISVRIDQWDTWSMDSTLAVIILPMLKQLKETKQGSPGSMPEFSMTSNSCQLCFPFYGEGDSLAWDAGHDRWAKILDEMIWTFEQLQPDYDWEDQYWAVHPELDLTQHAEDIGKKTSPIRWKVKGECDWDGLARHSDRIYAGLELFGKHYANLWD